MKTHPVVKYPAMFSGSDWSTSTESRPRRVSVAQTEFVLACAACNIWGTVRDAVMATYGDVDSYEIALPKSQGSLYAQSASESNFPTS